MSHDLCVSQMIYVSDSVVLCYAVVHKWRFRGVLISIEHRWMDGWMDGWIDGWMDGWMNG